jgi:hypothetical protein
MELKFKINVDLEEKVYYEKFHFIDSSVEYRLAGVGYMTRDWKHQRYEVFYDNVSIGFVFIEKKSIDLQDVFFIKVDEKYDKHVKEILKSSLVFTDFFNPGCLEIVVVLGGHSEPVVRYFGKDLTDYKNGQLVFKPALYIGAPIGLAIAADLKDTINRHMYYNN